MASADNPRAAGVRGGQAPAAAAAAGQTFDLRSILTTTIMYGFLIFSVISMMGGGGNKGDTAATSQQSEEPAKTLSRNHPTGVGERIGYAPLARIGDLMTIRVDPSEPVFEPIVFPNLPFDAAAMAAEKREVNRSVQLDACAHVNCSVTLTITWTIREQSFSTTAPLIRFLQEKKTVQKHRLFGEDHNHSEPDSTTLTETEPAPRYRAYIQPALTLNPVIDVSPSLPPQFASFTPVQEDRMVYGPAVYVNNFWVLRDHLREVNTSTAQEPFPFTVTVAPLAAWKLVMYGQFEQSMEQQMAMGLATADDMDDTKRIFLETNPYFLALTGIVTVLHMLFEYLAFSNDVKFWRGRKDFKGLSLRSIAVNCYFQTIIFLYLLDGGETSWTILLPTGLGVLLEFWKLIQTVRLVPVAATPAEPSRSASEDVGEGQTPSQQRQTENKPKRWSIMGYEMRFSDSYDKRTRKHDDTAMRYLVYIMIPVLIGYSVYSAVFNSHKSWYSFFINVQVQFIYFFGFVMMTPQIFINYKMKSVGQLPWRTFVYKSLNTVIDDLFAFIIKMPWLHRVACFRDDVVFVILLYQRWIYPVDMSRGADDEDGADAVEAEEQAPTSQPVATPSSIDDKKPKEGEDELPAETKKNQ